MVRFLRISTLLNQRRSATIVTITPTELIQITNDDLNQLLILPLKRQKMIIQLCEALSKRQEFQKVPFSENDLMKNLEPENELITKLAKQIFHRLDHSTNHIE